MNRLLALIFVIALAASPLCSSAQCPSDKYQWDFSLSYGFLTSSISNTGAGTDANKKVTQYPQTTFLTARYFIFNRLALGGAVGIASEKGTYNDPGSPSTVAGTYKASSTTVAVELYYIYFFRKYVEVYTFAGFGPSAVSEKATSSEPLSSYVLTTTQSAVVKAQYTPVGIRFGGRLGGYAELGYGYKGVVNLGISYKFGPSCWWKNDIR